MIKEKIDDTEEVTSSTTTEHFLNLYFVSYAYLQNRLRRPQGQQQNVFEIKYNAWSNYVSFLNWKLAYWHNIYIYALHMQVIAYTLL